MSKVQIYKQLARDAAIKYSQQFIEYTQIFLKKLQRTKTSLQTTLLVSLALVLVFFFHSLGDQPTPTCPCSPTTLKGDETPAFNATPPPVPKMEEMDVDCLEEHLSELSEDDPQLIHYTRVRHLTQPSKLPYNLKQSTAGDQPERMMNWVVNFFNKKRDGIFIEAGAHEGEYISNSLYLEKKLGWTGLLVECNPKLVPTLKMKHRKAWVADACLSVTKHAEVRNFTIPVKWSFSGRLGPPTVEIENPGNNYTFVDVPTVPLYTLLAALGWKDVDLFSLDIEGSELNVLELFPFEKVRFKLLVIETLGLWYNDTRKQEMKDFMKTKNYTYVREDWVDQFYVHNEFIRH